MDRNTFYVLCGLLRDHGGLKESKNMYVEERVAIFLNILGHDQKQRMIVRRLRRSKETVTRNFRQVLRSVLRLHKVLIKKPKPIQEDCTDERWKWFKNCIEALDGTYIKLKVHGLDKPRYRTRKGEIATNVLAACSMDMQFTYFLPGWEGSVANCRVLRDAISRRHPIKVPRGKD
ncbi:Protein ALP1-like [Bienertia sinuspersici]